LSTSQRDQEDYNLEHVNLEVTNIEQFDVVFARIKTLLNRLVELNNDVNGSMGELKTAYAKATRSFELNVSMGSSTDILLLDLSTKPEAKLSSQAKRARPSPQAVKELLSDPTIAHAGTELEHARLALLSHMEGRSDPVSLGIENDSPSGGNATLTLSADIQRTPLKPPELVRFNAALSQLRELLEPRGMFVIARVKPTLAFSSLALKVNLAKASGGGPATILDSCASSTAAILMDAEDYLIDRVHQVGY
jgi:hypothetical protein